METEEIIEVHVQNEGGPKKEEDQKQKALEEERESLVEDIKYEVAKAGEDVIGFKKFLEVFQNEGTKEPREFVGYKFGNLSFHEGKLEDLRLLRQNLSYAIDQFKKWKKEQAEPDDKTKPAENQGI